MERLSKAELDFIRQHQNDDISKLALKFKADDDSIRREVVLNQIDARKKCKGKLDFLLDYEEFIFPKSLSIEQASSEALAHFKASIAPHKHSIDLCGGMGIDSIFLAKTSNSHTYNELDSTLCDIFQLNLDTLNIENCSVSNSDAMHLLNEDIHKYDLIFIDPARRSKSGQKTYFLEDTYPNPITIAKKLAELNYHGKLLIKASPMVELQRAKSQLQQPNTAITSYILASLNECKEVMFLIDYNSDSLSTDEYCFTYNFEKDRTDFIKFDMNNKLSHCNTSDLGKYIYEPNAALMKLGLWQEVMSIFNISQMNPNTALFTSDTLREDFHGRIFELVSILQPNKKEIHSLFPNKKVNVLKRNYPISTAEIKKKYSLHDGGDDYLIFTTLSGNEKRALHCKRLK